MTDSQEFLQSEDWLRFQQAAGKEVMPFSTPHFVGNGILHTLPVVGRYLYLPRGPRGEVTEGIMSVINQALGKKAQWIRIEPETENALTAIRENIPYRVVKAPHDMQPKEVFQIDITKNEAELLSAMKSKTRYNIRLAEKKGIRTFATREKKYQEAFLDLITATSDRKGITPHPRSYYEKFFTALPEEICQLFIAEYEDKVLAAHLVIFFGDTATYLHGGSSDFHRDLMAPFLLQWEQIKEAKKRGCRSYDFGGVKIGEEHSSWAGITRFKTGFSPKTEARVFPGSYDIVLAPLPYTVYRTLQKVRTLFS
jgi:peptidoglycan pentaglycine glycine transferase (the first glycine)